MAEKPAQAPTLGDSSGAQMRALVVRQVAEDEVTATKSGPEGPWLWA